MKKFLVICLCLVLLFDVTIIDLLADDKKVVSSTNLISVDFHNTSLYTVLNVLSM